MVCLLGVLLITSQAIVSSFAGQLPYFLSGGGDNANLSALAVGGKWWAQMGEHVFYSPPPLLGLSQSINDYYYTLGSRSALTNEMKEHYVGGDGRLHILHLPRGPAMLQTMPLLGSRRTAFSRLNRLRSGMQLSGNKFPAYDVSLEYTNPLNVNAQAVEKAAVEMVNEAHVDQYLKEVTALYTRSWKNLFATKAAQNLVQRSFSEMGFKTCSHSFNHSGRTLVNVIAHVPGTSGNKDSITVGAHYDSRPFSGSAPGANDNGSGVASLLAIANAYKKSKVSPIKNVYFVSFAAEEAGCLGSDQFAKELHAASDGIPEGCRIGGSFLQTTPHSKAGTHASIVLDEVGWLSPKLLNATVNLESFDTADEIMQHLASASQEHNGNNLRIVHSSHPFGSDHMSFLSRGMDSVLTINGDDEAYPDYHTSSDTYEKVSPWYAAMIGKMSLGALLRMSGVQVQDG